MFSHQLSIFAHLPNLLTVLFALTLNDNFVPSHSNCFCQITYACLAENLLDSVNDLAMFFGVYWLQSSDDEGCVYVYMDNRGGSETYRRTGFLRLWDNTVCRFWEPLRVYSPAVLQRPVVFLFGYSRN